MSTTKQATKLIAIIAALLIALFALAGCSSSSNLTQEIKFKDITLSIPEDYSLSGDYGLSARYSTDADADPQGQITIVESQSDYFQTWEEYLAYQKQYYSTSDIYKDYQCEEITTGTLGSLEGNVAMQEYSRDYGSYGLECKEGVIYFEKDAGYLSITWSMWGGEEPDIEALAETLQITES